MTDITAQHRAYCELKQLIKLRYLARSASLPRSRRLSRTMAGTHQSRFRGRGMEFAEVRQYQPGDDVRSIDWRVTARRQAPHTKIFHEERERPVFIICDQSLSMFFGSRATFKSVVSAEIASLIAWTSPENGDRAGGIVFSDVAHSHIKPSNNAKTILRYLHELLEYNTQLSIEDLSSSEAAFDLNMALKEALVTLQPGNLIVLISDFIDTNEQALQSIKRLSQHNDVMAFKVGDPLEARLPKSGQYPMSDGQETLILNTNDKATKQRYEQWHSDMEDKLVHTFKSINAQIEMISTHSYSPGALSQTLAGMRQYRS